MGEEEEHTTAVNPVINLVGPIEEETSQKIIEVFSYLNHSVEIDSKEKIPITFYLSTTGGEAYDAFAIYDIMKIVLQSRKFEIHTYGIGKVFSAGVPILAAGTKGHRYISKHARIMIHNVISSLGFGVAVDLDNELEEVKFIQEVYIDMLSKDTKMTKAMIRKMMKAKTNVYLGAEEALNYGIADKII